MSGNYSLFRPYIPLILSGIKKVFFFDTLRGNLSFFDLIYLYNFVPKMFIVNVYQFCIIHISKFKNVNK